jgi:hypothetical protein
LSKFCDKVKRGKITGPRKREFTLDGWRNAYEEFSSNDKLDTVLHIAGTHIHTKLSAIRDTLAQSSLPRLSTETRVKALVAAANHQLESFELQLRRQAKEAASHNENTELNIGTLAKTQLKLASGDSYNVEAVHGGLLDGIVIPIRAALAVDRADLNDSFNEVNWGHVAHEINLGMLYDQTENLWEDCIWNTYAIGGKSNKMMAFPLDLEAKRGTHASTTRKLALSLESFSYAMQAIRSLGAQVFHSRIKEVLAVVSEDGKQKIQLGCNELDPHSQVMLFALRTMACPPYFESLLDQTQPTLAGATLSQIFDVWMVVSQAASRLWERTSAAYLPELPIAFNAICDMREYIPYFETSVLVSAAHEATGVPVAQVQAIIDFLTFRGKRNQEFWTQPLVFTGEQSKLYPMFGAVAKPPNLRYMVECWMAQLKIKLDERGSPFEAYLRAELVEAVENSPMLSYVAKVVAQDYTFRCADESFGQIDAIFCIGSCVFVVEAKCILEPTDSTSIGTHRSAIEHAVEQAKTRVKLIEEHREEFMTNVKQFGWSLSADFRIHPLVAVSTIAHVGVPWDGVPVVDEYVLSKFFAGGYEDVGLDTNDFSVSKRIFKTFYTDAAEAEAVAARYFEHPPQLRQYADALQLREVPIYAVSKDDWSGVMIDYEQG